MPNPVLREEAIPTYAPSQYRWSEQTQSYILSIGETIRQEALSGEWLEQITSFAFHSRSGMHFTARKQKVQRGTNYWYGYRRLHGRLLKHYLGKTSDLTLARLEEVARLLENESGQNRISPLLPEEIAPSQSSVHIPTPAGDPHVLSVTAQPLLLSKLLPPRLPQFLLGRPRLFALLDAGWRGCLTLLSAPAGFGKTTLVAQWVAARRALPDFPPVAWVSLEAADNDPLRFWRYLISACQAFQIDLTEAHAAWLASTPQPPFWPHTLETVATSLLNALTQCPAGSLLILEEYHAITAQEIHESLSFFLEHLPATIHLIIITRSDPPFSLARLRANNQLCEIRTADLSFSQEEMTILLHHSLPFELSSPTIQHLHAQLEGWGVGLHLTRLALQRTTTQTAGEQVVSRFLSSHPSFHEYFMNEVLQQQSGPIQQFLLQTSFLGYLTPSLCNAVTERQDSQEMLAFLEQTNVFCEALDPVAPDWPGSPQPIGQWYRYHSLFAEAMRGEAQRRFGEEYLRLFAVRAALWYEMHGFLNEAIDAALQSQDYPRAAVLIERSLQEQATPGEMQKPQIWHRWFTQFPEMVLFQRPILALSSAITLLFQSASWQPDASAIPFLKKLLHMAEEGFRIGDQRPKLGELFAFRAVLAVRRGMFQDAIHDAEQALGLLQPEQQLWRGIALSMVSEKWIKMGQLRQARATLYEAQALCSTAHNRFFKRIALIKFAQVCFDLGEQQQAAASLRQTLSEAREEAPTKLLANWCCVALLSLAVLSYESNELECAAQHLQEVLTLSQTHAFLQHEVQASILLARVQQVQDMTLVAQQHLTALFDRMPISLPSLARAIQTAQARLALSVGDTLIVQRWVTDRTPHPDSSREIEETLLVCRWLRVQGNPEEALLQLERLLKAVKPGENIRCLLEIQAELALVEAARRRKDEALRLLREVLAQACASNSIRLFLDAGEPMAVLLRSLLPQIREQPLPTFIRTLLSAFSAEQHDTATRTSTLLDPLSSQEIRVLRLLVQHHSNAEIADALVVSVNTVRSQVQSIYSKLGVHSRSAAIEAVRELQLL